MLLRALLTALLLSLLTGTAAGADTAAPAPAPPPDRQGAEGFGRAALRVDRRLERLEPVLDRRVLRIVSQPCVMRELERVPRRARSTFAYEMASVGGVVAMKSVRAAMARFVGELDAVAVTDPVLQRGRDAYHQVLTALDALPAPPARLCEALQRYRRAHYAAAAAPVDPAALPRFGRSVGLLERPVRRAQRRMRALGVSRRAAEAFGDPGL